MSCQADAEIHQGALAPYALFYTVTSTAASFDLSVVSAASFSVLREAGGTPETWAATIEGSPTAASVTIKHVFVANDVDDLEVLTVVPKLTTPGGDLLAAPKKLRVRSQYS